MKCQVCKEDKKVAEFPSVNSHRCLSCKGDKMGRCQSCNLIKEDKLFPFKKKENRPLFSRCIKCRSKHRAKKYRTLNGRIAKLISAVRSRSKKRGIDFSISKEWALDKVKEIDLVCQKTGKTMLITNKSRDPRSLSLDRIDPKKGYTKENVQFVCWAYNCMKSNMPEEELLNWCKSILSKQSVIGDWRK